MPETATEPVEPIGQPQDRNSEEWAAYMDPQQPLTEDDRAYRILEYLGLSDWTSEDVVYISEHFRAAQEGYEDGT